MTDLIQLAMNLDDMPEYEPLPAGQYRAEVRDVEIRHSEKVPTGYLYIVLRVDPSDYPVDYDAGNAPEGVNVTYANVKLPDPANRRTVKPFKTLVKSLGLDTAGTEFNPQDWIGAQLQVLLSTNVFQGTPVNNVEGVNAIPSA